MKVLLIKIQHTASLPAPLFLVFKVFFVDAPSKFGKFLVLYFGCGCTVSLLFNFATQMILHYLLPSPSCPWIKNLSAKTTKYILKCWEWSVKRKYNLSFIRVIKNSSFDQRFLIWLKRLSKFFGDDFFVLRSEHLLFSSVSLMCKTQNILTLPMLVYCNRNSFSLRSFSFMHWLLVCSVY